ncbi:MAG: hypothetical protein EZS28_007367 [Streblomastix strix]|uniref:Uncharacterized protein n=1 Tax=Streblomastix strix TaxID=222440 RepID=A0A5J4WSL7_9EUKA|nr:MAG: hypothetical protein EZS28_007367 [Streblomastix strix]
MRFKFYRSIIQRRQGFKPLDYRDRLKDITQEGISNLLSWAQKGSQLIKMDKQILLSSSLQRRSSWTDSEEEEEADQINPMALPNVSTYNVINNAIQTQVPEKKPQIVKSSTQQHLEVQMTSNIEFQGAWPVRSQAQHEQERAQERRTVKRRENRLKQSDQYWQARDPDQQALYRAIVLTNTISDYAAQIQEQNLIYYHDNTIEEQMIETEKVISALEARNKHRRDNLDKENETRTSQKESIEQTRTFKKDYIDCNPTLQVDRANTRSPRLPHPQIQHQIREVSSQEEDDLDKKILQLQEEIDMIQLRFEQEVHDTLFGELDCPSDLNNNEMDKYCQSEDSEETKDHLSIQGNKDKHMKMDKQNENENASKVKISLKQRSRMQTIRKWKNKANVMIPKSLELLDLRRREEDIREVRKQRYNGHVRRRILII